MQDGQPDSFFERMRVMGVGLRDQAMLDLGAGTGALALRYAQRGAVVSAIDSDEEMIERAQARAGEARLNIAFQTAPAEKLPFGEHVFDVVTANNCWHVFDANVAARQARWVLKAGGLLVTSNINWLPDEDKRAREVEELILHFRPEWPTGWHGVIAPMPAWAALDFRLRGMFYYDEELSFTRQSWLAYVAGQLAETPAKGIAPFDAAAIEKFSEALALRLEDEDAPETFGVRFRIDAHLLEPI